MPHVVEPPTALDVPSDEPAGDTPIFDLVTDRAAKGMLGKDLEIPKQPTAELQSADKDGETE